MAAALEFQSATKNTQQVFTSTSFADYFTATINRTGEIDAKDFIVIGHVAIGGTAFADQAEVRLRHDTGSATLFEYLDTVNIGSNTGGGHTFSFLAEINLSNASHEFSIEVARRTGSTGDIEAENGSLIILEKTSEMRVAERTTQFTTGTNEGYVDALKLAFTSVSRTVDYLVLFACNQELEDESNSGVEGSRFLRNDADDGGEDAVYQSENHGELQTSTNDNRPYCASGVVVSNITSSSSVNFAHRIQGNGINDEAKVNRSTIIAIPSDLFENFYSQLSTTKTFFTGQTFLDDLSITQTLNNAEHIVLFGTNISNENHGQIGIAAIHDGDGVVCNTHMGDDRDEDNNEFYCKSLYWADTFASGSRTIKSQCKSESTDAAQEAALDYRWLVVAEIPEGAAAAANPVLEFVVP